MVFITSWFCTMLGVSSVLEKSHFLFKICFSFIPCFLSGIPIVHTSYLFHSYHYFSPSFAGHFLNLYHNQLHNHLFSVSNMLHLDAVDVLFPLRISINSFIRYSYSYETFHLVIFSHEHNNHSYLNVCVSNSNPLITCGSFLLSDVAIVFISLYVWWYFCWSLDIEHKKF